MSNAQTSIPKYVPGFEAPFAELAAKDQLFDSAADAAEWVNEHGPSVLKAQGAEVVKNLLGAASQERRDRGVLILTRAVLAQVAWIESYSDFAGNGKFRLLKELTDAIRDSDCNEAEHAQACQAFIEAQLCLEEESQDRREALQVIGDFLKEEAFIEWVNEHGKLRDTRKGVTDEEWAVKALDFVRAGVPARVNTKTLEALARNLEFHARHFFGEGPKPAPKNPRKKNPGSAARRHPRVRDAQPVDTTTS